MKKPLVSLSVVLFMLIIGVITIISNPIERIQKEIKKAECIRQCKPEEEIKPCSAICQAEVWGPDPEETFIEVGTIPRDNSFKEH